MKNPIDRRNFIKTSLAASTLAMIPTLRGQESAPRPLKVGIVGCGGRSHHNLSTFLEAAALLGRPVEIMAIADCFQDAVDSFAAKFSVPAERCFTGFDAYRKVMASDAEFVTMATPPNFRPLHLAAAVEAGKHIFIEKPVAVDAPGCRRVIELGELARTKRLAIVAGSQRRHQGNYLRNKAQIDAGAIGKILGGTVSWNGSVPWIWERRPGWDDREYLIRNWVNFTEVSGDHIVEQHVHNVDVANWFIGRTPVSAIGFGGRARRESGNQFDFFSVDFDYGDGVHIHSQCRQISGAYNRVGEFFRGSEGMAYGGGKIEGREVAVPEISVLSEDGTIQEMVNLILAADSQEPINEARSIAESTAATIMGRISAYTGSIVQWTDLMTNEQSPHYAMRVGPDPLEFETGTIVLPSESVFPIPGDGAPIARRG
ncbi:MAG TPA: Gfo/Idh/MocA family oxidoreductase [Opitutaceae bacterium]|nr:Gfo/Idh/MocA family oxidoreductase [Opitutaceae bacterium]